MRPSRALLLLAAFAVLLPICAAVEDPDYYKVLGVARDATGKQIKKAFRDLSLKYHPDKNAGNPEAEKKYMEIQQGAPRAPFMHSSATSHACAQPTMCSRTTTSVESTISLASRASRREVAVAALAAASAVPSTSSIFVLAAADTTTVRALAKSR